MIKNAAKAFATLATAAALIGGSAMAVSAATEARPAPEPTVTLDPRPFPRPVPTPYPTLRPHRVPVLYDVDAYDRRGCDQVVFHFRGDAPDAEARYVRRPTRLLPGRAFLLVRFEDARVVRDLRGTRYLDLDVVRAHRLLDADDDGDVLVALGLRHRAPFFVRTLDDRVVLTVCDWDYRGPHTRDDRH